MLSLLYGRQRQLQPEILLQLQHQACQEHLCLDSKHQISKRQAGIMSEEITIDIFNHLVTLAALELDEKQAAYLRRELNQQLKAIHELEAIPLDADMPTTTHGVTYNQANSPALREDTWQSHPNPDEILQQAPQVEDHYIIVPDIPHEKLD